MNIQIQPEFDEILQQLGNSSAEFFLAASLYHAHKITFTSAAHLVGLDFESFQSRLMEHFNQGYILAEECILEDIQTVDKL